MIEILQGKTTLAEASLADGDFAIGIGGRFQIVIGGGFGIFMVGDFHWNTHFSLQRTLSPPDEFGRKKRSVLSRHRIYDSALSIVCVDAL